MAAESTFLYLRIWMPSFDDKQVFASVCMTIYHVAYDPFKCSLCIICSNVPPILSQHDFVSPVPHLPTASMNCWTKLLSWWMITSESENSKSNDQAVYQRYDLAQKFCQRALEQEADHPRSPSTFLHPCAFYNFLLNNVPLKHVLMNSKMFLSTPQFPR